MKYNLKKINSENISIFLDQATQLLQNCFPIHYIAFDKPLVENWIKDDNYCWVGAILSNNNLIGLINSKRESDFIILQDVCVKQNYRKMGISTALAKEIINISINKWGMKKFKLYATKKNFAHKIALKIGFKIIRELPEHHIKNSPVFEMINLNNDY